MAERAYRSALKLGETVQGGLPEAMRRRGASGKAG